MINLSYDITTGVARVLQPSTVKVGADVPVRVTFSAAPGEITAMELALGSEATPPAVLAYTEDFTQESATVWLATLDASDSRLVEYMAARGATAVNVELACLIDGKHEVAPNVAVTVQPRVISGPESTEGGPNYLTEAQSDARYLQTERWTASLILFGEAVVDQVFDRYQTDRAGKLTAIEISAQDAPSGTGGITIQLIDGLGANVSAAVTLATGTNNVRATLGTPLAIALDSILRAKVTAVGGTDAGGWLNVRLSFKP